MKGFAGVLLLFAVILAAGILLMSNMQTKEEYSFKEIIPQTKAQITNFEITLKQIANNCDFSNPTNATSCIDSNATTILGQQQLSDCTIPSQTKQITGTNSYELTLVCKKSAKSGANTITLDVNRNILLKKI